MRIGITAVQGAFIEHEKMLEKLGIAFVELRKKADLETEYNGLILPGGESTVQGKLLRELDMFDTIKAQINAKMPVLATCAGMILLAEELSNDDKKYFGTIPMTVTRNAYGRQLGSFRTVSPFYGLGDIPMTFIRAPYVQSYGPDVQVLSEVNNRTVAVQYENQIALAFHPELDEDTGIYKKFLDLIR